LETKEPDSGAPHRSGFVNIVGRPNVGKSTLMNALVGERMSIITPKAQTTRHRIIGILSGDDFQIVFSDTPGFIQQPAYRMHEAMNAFVRSTFEDADLMLFMIEPGERYADDDPLLERLRGLEAPIFLVLNKIDLLPEEQVEPLLRQWRERVSFAEAAPISALHQYNTGHLLESVMRYLPEGPAYYPKDQLSDRPERFFVSEIIREKIMLLYHQEIPYFTEVIVTDFKDTHTKEGQPLARIEATIFVGRKTQKAILIGKDGAAIKLLGTEARRDIERFLERKVFLELFVKVKDNWRDDEAVLRQFGYK
jgi:GTP-binding protein Era